MKTILLSTTIVTVSPLSICMPVAEGARENDFGNFPLMTAGLTDDGQKIMTGYLPASTVRGFLRRTATLSAMQAAADEGKPMPILGVYGNLLGQDGSHGGDDEDLVAVAEQRKANPIIDLFGAGLSTRSRLLVSHFMPSVPVLPDPFSGVRKDLSDTEGVLEQMTPEDVAAYYSRNSVNADRVGADTALRKVRFELRKAKKAGDDVTDLEAAVKAAEAKVEELKDQMGELRESSRTLTTYWALGAGIPLKGRLIVERATERDLQMIEQGLDALSMRPLLGAQVARGAGEIKGEALVSVDGKLVKKITFGGFEPSRVIDFTGADTEKLAA